MTLGEGNGSPSFLPWRRKWQPTPVFLTGEFHGQRSLVCYSPWRCKQSDMAEQLTFISNWTELKIFKTFTHISSVQFLSRVWFFVTPWTAACQASLSITNSQSLLRLMSIESVMPSNHLILCHPLLLLPSIFPSIKVFFQWFSSAYKVAEVLESQLQHPSLQWIFRTDFL